MVLPESLTIKTQKGTGFGRWRKNWYCRRNRERQIFYPREIDDEVEKANEAFLDPGSGRGERSDSSPVLSEVGALVVDGTEQSGFVLLQRFPRPLVSVRPLPGGEIGFASVVVIILFFFSSSSSFCCSVFVSVSVGFLEFESPIHSDAVAHVDVQKRLRSFRGSVRVFSTSRQRNGSRLSTDWGRVINEALRLALEFKVVDGIRLGQVRVDPGSLYEKLGNMRLLGSSWFRYQVQPGPTEKLLEKFCKMTGCG